MSLCKTVSRCGCHLTSGKVYRIFFGPRSFAVTVLGSVIPMMSLIAMALGITAVSISSCFQAHIYMLHLYVVGHSSIVTGKNKFCSP